MKRQTGTFDRIESAQYSILLVAIPIGKISHRSLSVKDPGQGVKVLVMLYYNIAFNVCTLSEWNDSLAYLSLSQEIARWRSMKNQLTELTKKLKK